MSYRRASEKISNASNRILDFYSTKYFQNENVNSSIEPASTKGSTVALRDDTVSTSATVYNGHTVERRVIKELKTYIADTDPEGIYWIYPQYLTCLA